MVLYVRCNIFLCPGGDVAGHGWCEPGPGAVGAGPPRAGVPLPGAGLGHPQACHGRPLAPGTPSYYFFL